MQSSLFLLSAVVAAVSATHPLALPKLKRDLEVRQTDLELSPSCTSAVLDLYTAIPTPPPSLMSAALDGELQSVLASPCDASLPASLSSDLEEYASEVQTWYSSHSSDVSSVLSQCSDLTSLLGGDLTQSFPVCSTTAGSGSSSRTTSGSASRTPSSRTASQTSDESSTLTTATSGTAASGSSQTSSQTGSAASASATQPSSGFKASASLFAAVAAGVFAVVAL